MNDLQAKFIWLALTTLYCAALLLPVALFWWF